MTGTVYLIRKGDYLKIGITSDINRRLAEYQRAPRGTRYPDDLDVTAPAELVFQGSGDTSVETLVMAAMHEEHAVGEWFHYRGVVRATVERLGRGNLLFPGRTARRLSVITRSPYPVEL